MLSSGTPSDHLVRELRRPCPLLLGTFHLRWESRRPNRCLSSTCSASRIGTCHWCRTDGGLLRCRSLGSELGAAWQYCCRGLASIYPHQDRDNLPMVFVDKRHDVPIRLVEPFAPDPQCERLDEDWERGRHGQPGSRRKRLVDLASNSVAEI